MMGKSPLEIFIKLFFDIFLWKGQAEDGRRKAKWDGNGKERDLRKRKEREKWREVDSFDKFINN